jgi:hypothetical protein
MAHENIYKYVQGISYQTRWKEVHSEELSLSGAFRAFRGLLASEKENSAKKLLDFVPSKLDKKEWQQFEKYIAKRYDNGIPKKRYSMFYIWQFFDKLAKIYYLEHIEKTDLTEEKKARLQAAQRYLVASKKEKQDKKAQSK